MNIRSKVWLALSFVLIASMSLAACTTPTPEVVTEREIVTQIVTEVVTQETVVEREVLITPTPAPSSRTGGWLDRIVIVEEESQEAAVTRLQSGDIDLYAFSADDANVFETVKADPNLQYTTNFGSYNELTLNVAEFADGRLNPFSNPKIREAINWLVDRDYIVEEIAAGLGAAKYFTINPAFPDYARYIETIRELEALYAYDPDRANEVITAEMEGMGATLTDGVWSFNGEPISLVFLIRVEDTRLQIGDYVANQLETVGFTVDRQYKTRTEASPIWGSGDPAEGQWHIYTGGWITQIIDRDEGENFSFFYGPYDYPIPLHQAYQNTPEFDEVMLKLRNNDFTTLEERAELFREALVLSLQDSARVWIIDQTSFTPYNGNLNVTGDMAGGVSGGYQWPHTLRWADEEGGSVRIAQPGNLIDPWNPVAGSNWVYDGFPQRALSDNGVMYDPFTGLVYPYMIERADVVVQEGLPVGATLDWVTLEFSPEIVIPDDAWVDWDATEGRWITASEKYTETQTALTKSTVYYPEDFFETVTWHDGSNISVGDFMLGMIMTFDQGKPESPIFDEAAASALEAFLAHFKGVKIISTDPLVIETYDDTFSMDAEIIPTTWFPSDLGTYVYGTGMWTNVGVGILAETAGELAFSTDKATANDVEWTSFISGPSLEILSRYLDQAVAEGYLPYASVMSEYVTADEIAARWANLDQWYSEQGHFWVGTGPYYLDKVFPIEGTLTLLRYEDYPFPANRWDIFAAPKIAEVELDGPGTVNIDEEAAFDVFVDFEGEPYPVDEVDQVKWLLFDATGTLAGTGDAENVGEGEYQVVLPADVTSNLAAGSNRLEIAVTSKVISVPSLDSLEFVTVAP